MRSVVCIFMLLLIHKTGFSENDNLRNPSFGLYTYSDLSQIKNVSPNERDATLLIARKAEQFFHKMLNDYRSKLGKSKLEWFDLHWVAAYNHNNWMAENESLSHYQSPGSTFYSGSSPKDRLRFVNDQDFKMYYSGENCLYNWLGYSTGSTDEKAEKLAKKLFRQWKLSPGHYANMINDSHKGHAVAFFIESSGKVWGTSMFGAYRNKKASLSEVRRNDVARYTVAGVAKNTLLIRGENTEEYDKSIRLSSSNISKYLKEELKAKADSTSKKQRRYIVKAANKHADYLSQYRTYGETQSKRRKLFYGETTKDRLNKASFFWTLFTGKAKKAKSASTTFVFNDSIISIKSILDEVMQDLEDLDNDYSYYGYGVKVRKKSGIYFVTVNKIII